MPQMSPLLWTLMLIFTTSLLIIISSFLYFTYTPDPSKFSSPLKSKTYNHFIWLW